MFSKAGICFLHGLDSSPEGTKGRLIRASYPESYMPHLPPRLQDRLEIIEKALRSPVILVGSSLGGLTALAYAQRNPRMVKAMVLLAPAVGITVEGILEGRDIEIARSIVVPPGIPATIIAGVQDEVVPLSSIRALVERSPDRGLVRFITADDDHYLHQSLELMMQVIGDYLKAIP
ncbi:MAG: alpha/beta hydrolase [Desulfobacteraceae bacterium]|nr:MAG: alpha/beta hydrolase [Desulfobacteraceae bacterium]